MTQPFIPLFKVRMDEGAGYLVNEVLSSGYIGQGPKCEEFERQFGEVVGAPEPPLLLNSCTSAIDLALHLCGLNDGQKYEVITTPITCTATNSPPALRNARLVWADVDPLTGNISKESVMDRITNHTKAVIAVNWGGRSCDPDHAPDGQALHVGLVGIPERRDLFGVRLEVQRPRRERGHRGGRPARARAHVDPARLRVIPSYLCTLVLSESPQYAQYPRRLSRRRLPRAKHHAPRVWP